MTTSSPRSSRAPRRVTRRVILCGAAVLGATSLTALAPPAPARGASLRGSRASVERMHHFAVAHAYPFYEAPVDVRRAARAGQLVPLPGSRDYRVHAAVYPFVRPATRAFVERVAAWYRHACGVPLVVTSGVRPATDQPDNSTGASVHPTGMAVDLRKPAPGPCREWLRGLLLSLERGGVVEATEEFAPPHFHVAVFRASFTHPAPARRSHPVSQRAPRAERRGAGAASE